MKFLLDTHCHTISSGHAYSTISEYIKEAQKKNLSLIAITDHAPKMPGSCGEFYFGNLKILPHKFNDLEVWYGSELNIIDYDGNLDLPESIIKDLDIVIASFHPPCLEPLTDNTETIMKVMSNPYVDVIGHPGDPRILFDIPKVVAFAKETGTILEINNSSLNPNSTRFGGIEIIKKIINECKKISWPVIVGSDAHFHLNVANFDLAKELLEDMPEELILNTSVDLFKKFIRKNKK
jgi:Histidinol phosphatase and related hydrolases of the PHP family